VDVLAIGVSAVRRVKRGTETEPQRGVHQPVGYSATVATGNRCFSRATAFY
jgi:hypothetical protein